MKSIELTGEIIKTNAPFAVPLDAAVVKITPVQSGSGDPSPTNVRPISGWTGAKVTISPSQNAQDGTTYDITFPSEAGTVYGGTLDVTNGTLVVEYAKMTFDGGQNIIKNTDSLMRYYNSMLADGYFSSDNKVVSSWLKNSSTTADTNQRFYQSNGAENRNIYFANLNKIDATLVTVDAVKAYFANNPLEVVYKLATPQTYQLTPTQIALLAGENNVWADCGDIAIAYRPYHRFAFDGINSIDNGMYVIPTDSMVAAPARQYTEQVVPGRSGVLLMDDGRYDNILHEYQVVTDDDGETNIALLRNMLASSVGYCRLTDTFDPDHYYMAVYNQNFTPVLEWRKRDMAKAVVSFYRKPQRFLLTGENAVVLTSSGSITNPTRFKSKPFIRVYGSGVLGVGSTNITIASHGYSYMDIDCETGRAYYGATSLDSKVTLNAIDFPTLNPGANGISKGSGITRIEITPRWWEL